MMKWYGALAAAVAILSGFAPASLADQFTMPGVVPPSGCRVGAVLSTDQFISTGFSNVRTARPNDEVVAGAWVVANNFTPDTSILLPPNCFPVITAIRTLSGTGLNLMAVRIRPTASSAAEAAIREVKLVWDVNADGLYDPLLDLVLQSKPGQTLDSQDGVVFFNGAQSPLAVLSDVLVLPPLFGCGFLSPDIPPTQGIGPTHGTNSNGAIYGCFIALLAVVSIGEHPKTGSQFGLSLEALAGDIPGTTGISSFSFSSGFSSSRNPQASNVRVQIFGGLPSSHTPLEHLSNSSGGSESAVRPLSFNGGARGEGLLTRFRALEIRPGTREAIAMAVGLCDGAELANTRAAILPPIAGAPPTLAGGLASLPCIPSAGTDGYATGISGATLIFRGPLARYMGTVRMYADECSAQGIVAGLCIFPPATGVLPPNTATIQGGGDGILFQPGELSELAIPKFNEQTGEAIVQFGGQQGEVLFTDNGSVVAAGADPSTPPIDSIPVGTRPLIIIWTVDIDQHAPGGRVEVLLGLQSYDDSAHHFNLFSFVGPCFVFFSTATATPVKNGIGTLPGICGSNFLNTGPETYSFTVEGPEHPSTPNSLSAFDTNQSCFIDDPEFFAMIDGWVAAELGDTLFFAGVDAWVAQGNICTASSNSFKGLSLKNVTLEASSPGFTTFVVTGHGIASMNVEVFSLSGHSVFSQSVKSSELHWSQTTTSGAPLANGTYLYVVTVTGADGQTLKSDVNKLVVLR